MDLYEAMHTLRAVRRLRPDPIPDDVLTRVLDAACHAPTGGNVQPWRVIVVRDTDRKAALADIYAPEWAAYRDGFKPNLVHLPADEQAKWDRIIAAGDHLADHLADAPAIAVFVFQPQLLAVTDAGLDRVSVIGGASIYPAVQNFLLACRAEGLGCTLTTLHCMREAEVKAALDIPDPWGTAALIPIGYPVGRGHGPISRRPPKVLAFEDSFGNRWAH